ncbi:MAG: hypothetical protein ACRDZ1_03640 [Acidimicrobiia bacterium]
MKPMIVGALGALLAGVFGVAQAQEAQQVPTIDIPINTVVDDAPPFEQHILATQAVDPAEQGLSCEVTIISTNQESAHPGNNLVIGSNGSAVIAPDVEREAGAVTEAVGTLVLGPTVTVELLLGPDHVFSAGLVVSIDCIQVSPEPPVVRPPVVNPPVVNPPAVNPPAVTPPSPASTGNPATADIAVAAASVVAPARFTG